MANTSPVTDTAEAAELLYDRGRTVGLVDVIPVGAVTKGLGGEELAELGLMARSRARVRLFSDDGLCVQDARVMRRALEYLKPFDGVISQHAQDSSLAGAGACSTPCQELGYKLCECRGSGATKKSCENAIDDGTLQMNAAQKTVFPRLLFGSPPAVPMTRQVGGQQPVPCW